MAGAADRGGRISRDDLAGHQPIEQMAQRRQAQLRCWRSTGLGLLLDPGGDVQWLYGRDHGDAVILAPGQEVGGGAAIGAPCVRVADRAPGSSGSREHPARSFSSKTLSATA